MLDWVLTIGGCAVFIVGCLLAGTRFEKVELTRNNHPLPPGEWRRTLAHRRNGRWRPGGPK